MASLYQILTSDAALYVTIFLAGGTTVAWIDHWLDKLDKARSER